MIEELLRYLASGQTYTLSTLAQAVGVSEELIERMLADLERGGYVVTADMACEGHCEGCPMGSLCAMTHGKRIWSLTEKGRRAAV